jgi:hypothetical protein
MMSRTISQIRGLICVLPALAMTACLAADVGFRISIAPPSALEITGQDKRVELRLSHTIDGYLVNCERSRMLAWGKPFKLNPDNPQDGVLSIIDTQDLKIQQEVHLSKGIHSAEFLSSKAEAIIWTDVAIAIDLDTGKTLPQPDQLEFDAVQYPREACPDFPYKAFNRYRE